MTTGEIILAIATAITTAATAWLAVHRANKLSIYRIQKLEEKVEVHNGLDRRIVALEAEVKFLRGERK
ncbi:MAG: hypothetical protein FWD16_02600 [Clostridia bacterium]|nr:hypothetical protein [Clostridia bacterium]